MEDQKRPEGSTPQPEGTGDEDDTEGHNMLPNDPAMTNILHRARSAEVDREVRFRIFRKDAEKAKRRKA